MVKKPFCKKAKIRKISLTTNLFHASLNFPRPALKNKGGLK
jgi:hypothetical protein